MADNYLHMQRVLLQQPHGHVEGKPYRVDLADNGTVTFTMSDSRVDGWACVLTGSTVEGRAQLFQLASEIMRACAKAELP